MREIIITKHAIVEYIKDNRKCKNPTKKLKELFIKMLTLSKTKECIFYNDHDRKASFMIYDDEKIIYNDYTIITYYRLFNISITKYKRSVHRKIYFIFSGRREKQIQTEIDRHEKRKLKRQAKRKNNENRMNRINKVYSAMAKSFNTR